MSCTAAGTGDGAGQAGEECDAGELGSSCDVKQEPWR